MNHDVEELSVLVWRAAKSLNTSVGEVCPTEFVYMILLNFTLNEQSPYSAKVREEAIKVFQSNAEQGRYTGLKHSGASKDLLAAVETTVTDVLNEIAKQASLELAAIENLVNNAEHIPAWIKNFRRNDAVKSMLNQMFYSRIYAVSSLLGRNQLSVSNTYFEAFQQEIKTQMQEKNVMNVQWADHEFNQRVLENNDRFIQSVEEAFDVALCGAKTITKAEIEIARNKVRSVLNNYKNDVEQGLENGVSEKVEQTPSQYVQRLKLQTAEAALKKYRRSI